MRRFSSKARCEAYFRMHDDFENYVYEIAEQVAKIKGQHFNSDCVDGFEECNINKVVFAWEEQHGCSN